MTPGLRESGSMERKEVEEGGLDRSEPLQPKTDREGGR